MGLFSSKKNLCPICGEPTPRLFPTKVEDMPICKDCAAKIRLPEGALDRMSVGDLQEYLGFYDGNQALRDQFQPEYIFDVDGWKDELQVDFTRGLFRMSTDKNGIVFEAGAIRSFVITEDDRLLYEGSGEGMTCYESEVPMRMERLMPDLERYYEEKREYERMQALRDMLRKDDKRPQPYIAEPVFDPAMPVDQYHVTLTLDHPYWSQFTGAVAGPNFGILEPDANTFWKNHEKCSAALEELAGNLMRLFAPNAPVTRAGNETAAAPQPAPASSVDTVAEIRKYKELLDAGIISEEEFTAKKRQLMGI